MDVRDCNNNCNVQTLSQLWLCQEPNCSAPLIRCSGCFKFAHSIKEDDKRKLHAHKKFNQSSIYDKFLYFIKLYEVIEKKFKREFGKTNDHVAYFATQIFNSSSFITVFLSQEALLQFHILKEIYYGRPCSFQKSPSADLSSSLSLFSEKQYINAKNKLIQVKKEYELDLGYYNQVSTCNVKYLVQFISKEQAIFTEYCDGIREKNQEFHIKNYIKQRQGQEGIDRNYFTPIFQTFLYEKYSENPENESLFTDYEYICYFWENLELFLNTPDRKAYVNTWVQDYNTFSAFMSANSLESNLLSFRLWRNHTSSEKIRINDQYFLDNFVFSYVQFLINLEGAIGSKPVSWEEYLTYFKEFSEMYKSSNQVVDVFKYSDYFMFRTKTKNFILALKQSKDISYHQVYCTEYINSSYKDGSILSKKNYQKFLKTKQDSEIEENNKFKAIAEEVSKQIQQQQGQKYYKIVYNDYLKQALKQKVFPTKEGYLDFKKEILQSYDQTYIKETNDRLLLEQKEQLEKLLSDTKNDKVEKVSFSIDEVEAQVAQKGAVQNEDSQDEGVVDENCVCCEGRPEQCQKQQCQAMGFCVICSL